jgi:hypothetical protein
MKKILCFALFVFFASAVFAQSPRVLGVIFVKSN